MRKPGRKGILPYTQPDHNGRLEGVDRHQEMLKCSGLMQSGSIGEVLASGPHVSRR